MDTPSLFPQDYKKISFTQNWNNKLNCKFFTTIRLQKNKFKVGDLAIVDLAGKEIKLVQVVAVKDARLYEMDSTLTLLDAGYMPNQFRELMHRMYSKQVISVDDAPFIVLTLATLEVYSIAPNQ